MRKEGQPSADSRWLRQAHCHRPMSAEAAAAFPGKATAGGLDCTPEETRMLHQIVSDCIVHHGGKAPIGRVSRAIQSEKQLNQVKSEKWFGWEKILSWLHCPEQATTFAIHGDGFNSTVVTVGEGQLVEDAGEPTVEDEALAEPPVTHAPGESVTVTQGPGMKWISLVRSRGREEKRREEKRREEKRREEKRREEKRREELRGTQLRRHARRSRSRSQCRSTSRRPNRHNGRKRRRGKSISDSSSRGDRSRGHGRNNRSRRRSSSRSSSSSSSRSGHSSHSDRSSRSSRSSGSHSRSRSHSPHGSGGKNKQLQAQSFTDAIVTTLHGNRGARCRLGDSDAPRLFIPIEVGGPFSIGDRVSGMHVCLASTRGGKKQKLAAAHPQLKAVSCTRATMNEVPSSSHGTSSITRRSAGTASLEQAAYAFLKVSSGKVLHSARC